MRQRETICKNYPRRGHFSAVCVAFFFFFVIANFMHLHTMESYNTCQCASMTGKRFKITQTKINKMLFIRHSTGLIREYRDPNGKSNHCFPSEILNYDNGA